MTVTTFSAREFNQDTGRAREAATTGPVFITDRGEPAHVLLSIEEYRRITEGSDNVVDQLGLPVGVEEVEIDFPPARDLVRAADIA